jgi:hypothetical protein
VWQIKRLYIEFSDGLCTCFCKFSRILTHWYHFRTGSQDGSNFLVICQSTEAITTYHIPVNTAHTHTEHDDLWLPLPVCFPSIFNMIAFTHSVLVSSPFYCCYFEHLLFSSNNLQIISIAKFKLKQIIKHLFN